MRMALGCWLAAVWLVAGTVTAAPEVPLWGKEAAKWVEGGREFYVSPEGKAENPGTKAAPWDLRSAIGGKQKLQGGDVVWVGGGVYRGCFTVGASGSPGKPVVFRAVPGQRAVLDGVLGENSYVLTLVAPVSWCVVWGMEITASDSAKAGVATGARNEGFLFDAPNSKLVNCHIHDTANCGWWRNSIDSEFYGCISYNIGGQNVGRGQGNGHNLYTQNKDGTKRIRDNIIFNGFRNCIDIYTGSGYIEGYHIIGNTVFGASACANEGDRKMNIIIGSPRQSAARILLRENMLWSNGLGRSCEFGYRSDGHKDIRLFDNVFAGRVEFRQWETVEMRGNKFYGELGGPVDRAKHPDNYYGPPPKESVVFVRPNEYEPGRGNITVYNWAGADAVAADIGNAVPVGAEFEIRNAQNWHKGPVAKGVFDGKPVSLPMVGMEPVQPLGAEGNIAPEEMTGKAFNVFVVQAWTPGTRSSR